MSIDIKLARALISRVAVCALLLCGSAVAARAAVFAGLAEAQVALSSGTARQRLDAIRFLGSLPSAEAGALLAGRFQAEPDAYLRVRIVEALDVQGSTWAVVCAEAAAGDKNDYVRRSAAAPLGRRAAGAGPRKKLEALAADSSEAVRLEVVNALEVMQGTAAVAITGRILSDGRSSARTRRAAARALQNRAAPDADAELGRHAGDADPEIKAAALARGGKVPAEKAGGKAKPAEVVPARKKVKGGG